jgi:hypothetical protein
MVPPPNANARWRMAVHIGGGPVAYGLTAICLWLLQAHALLSAPLNAFLGLIALTSFFIGAIMPTIPVRKGPYRTDGALLIWLLLGGAERDLARAHSRVLGMEMHGVRARDWDKACITRLVSLAHGKPAHLFTALILYEWHLDRGEFAAAGDWIDCARETPEAEDQYSRGNVLAESAYFEAVHRYNPEKARQWLEQAGSHWTLQGFVRKRAEAAVLLSEGRFLESIESYEQALAMLRWEFPSGKVPACQQEWVLDIRARALQSAGEHKQVSKTNQAPSGDAGAKTAHYDAPS